jgi:hypothetical protein
MPRKNLEELMLKKFNVSERIMPALEDLKQGQTLDIVANFKVMEKTRKFTILRITHANPISTSRSL